MSQRSKVINLYKTLLHLGKDYPKGYDYFRTRLHSAFMKNKDIQDPETITKLLNHGTFVAKEIEALYMLRKYRHLRRNYYLDEKENEDSAAKVDIPNMNQDISNETSRQL